MYPRRRWDFDQNGKDCTCGLNLRQPGRLPLFAPCVPTSAARHSCVRDCTPPPAINVDVTGVFTHTVMVDAYAALGARILRIFFERLMDTAALEMKMDPVELRRKNFIPGF